MPRSMQSNNSSGVEGLRPKLRPSCTAGAAPHLQIQAHWMGDGRVRCTTFSVANNGLMHAVELAIKAREAGSGKPVGLTPRKAWNRMRHLVGGWEQ